MEADGTITVIPRDPRRATVADDGGTPGAG
jgi:hypothetical protein